MSQLPMHVVPEQSSSQSGGRYIEITCAVRCDYTWRIPFYPGRQDYVCPACLGKTTVRINYDGISIDGDDTYETRKIDKLRLNAAIFNQLPGQPSTPQDLEDLLNSMR